MDSVKNFDASRYVFSCGLACLDSVKGAWICSCIGRICEDNFTNLSVIAFSKADLGIIPQLWWRRTSEWESQWTAPKCWAQLPISNSDIPFWPTSLFWILEAIGLLLSIYFRAWPNPKYPRANSSCRPFLFLW